MDEYSIIYKRKGREEVTEVFKSAREMFDEWDMFICTYDLEYYAFFRDNREIDYGEGL